MIRKTNCWMHKVRCSFLFCKSTRRKAGKTQDLKDRGSGGRDKVAQSQEEENSVSTESRHQHVQAEEITKLTKSPQNFSRKMVYTDKISPSQPRQMVLHKMWAGPLYDAMHLVLIWTGRNDKYLILTFLREGRPLLSKLWKAVVHH